MLHCQDGKADCSDVLYIFSVRIAVSYVVQISVQLVYKMAFLGKFLVSVVYIMTLFFLIDCVRSRFAIIIAFQMFS